MQNKKTTIAGYLLIGAAVLHVAAAFLTGGDISVGIADLLAALTGAGLIAARDGGH